MRAAQAEKFARDDRIVVLDAGDRLPGYALAVITEELGRAPDLEVIYTDEDTIGPGDPIFKPDWSPVLYRHSRYVGRRRPRHAPDGNKQTRGSPATALDRISGESAPPADKACELLCEDHVGTYRLPYLCCWVKGTWRSVKTGEPVKAGVVGWRAALGR